MPELNNRLVDFELSECEKELRNMGFSDDELQKLYGQIDGIIERTFDKYLSDFFDI